jgi:hypothetical protein
MALCARATDEWMTKLDTGRRCHSMILEQLHTKLATGDQFIR